MKRHATVEEERGSSRERRFSKRNVNRTSPELPGDQLPSYESTRSVKKQIELIPWIEVTRPFHPVLSPTHAARLNYSEISRVNPRAISAVSSLPIVSPLSFIPSSSTIVGWKSRVDWPRTATRSMENFFRKHADSFLEYLVFTYLPFENLLMLENEMKMKMSFDAARDRG